VLEAREHEVVLIIEDNGRGFIPEEEKTSSGREIGLAGVRERTTLMMGKVEIESAEGKGTTIFVRIPLQFSNDGNMRE
jgi:two-component system sensor histidine kinase DegS